MSLFSRLTSQCLKTVGLGLVCLSIALPVGAQGAGKQSITEIAGSNDSFDTLASLLEHAGWLGFFDGSNGKEFTIFAPTDDAFANLPKGKLESLYKPENKESLYDFLAYHIIGGSVTSDMLSSGSVDTKAKGLSLKVNVDDEVMVNNATVSTANIAASNGVIHAIDTVLIPKR